MFKLSIIAAVILSGFITGSEPPEVTAERLFKEKKYAAAREFFEQALESRQDFEGVVHFNLAQCLVKLDSLLLADELFNRAEDADKGKVSSMAFNNRGCLKVLDKKLEESLKFFQDALRNNPNNEEARYNYELIKKIIKKNQPPPQQDPPPSQQPPPQQKPKSNEGSGDPSEEKEMTKAEAKALLDAMEQTERDARKNMKIQIRGGGPSRNKPAW